MPHSTGPGCRIGADAKPAPCSSDIAAIPNFSGAAFVIDFVVARDEIPVAVEPGYDAIRDELDQHAAQPVSCNPIYGHGWAFIGKVAVSRRRLADAAIRVSERPLDFDFVCGGGFSDPGTWPHPYTIRPGQTRPEMVEVAPRHFVCMAADEVSQPLRAAS